MGYDLPAPSFSRLDAANLRTAGRDVLGLALMDARNHTLFLIGEYQKVIEGQGIELPCWPELEPPLWVLGHVGWYQERWIGRNLQRHRGPRAEAGAPRLPSLLRHADFWWDGRRLPHAARWTVPQPPLDEIKAYLLQTLESTLDLLARTPDEHDALFFYRLALFHEDRWGERLVEMAQTLGLRLKLPLPAPGLVHAPLVCTATRWSLGLDPGAGFSHDHERPVHEIAVPEFEIDAQPVSWSQYVEFVADGGYDREELWHADGWQWMQSQAEGRRAPRHVEQIGLARGGGQGGVLQRWFGQTVRVAGWSPVMHVSWWEADAWCRWAGRRLPSEVEWELAAHQARGRGMRWGDVREWTGTTFQPLPGHVPDDWCAGTPWPFGMAKVVRGASLATRQRLKSAKSRDHALPGRDDAFVGFRSCAP